MKLVGGLPGDEIEVAAGSVAVNGERLPNSATLARDSMGRPLSACVVGQAPEWRRIRSGCWVSTTAEAGIRDISVPFLGAVRGRRGAGADVVTVMAERTG